MSAANPECRVFVAGHRGMVGSALVRALRRRGGVEILTADRGTLDLRRQAAVESWLDQHRPDQVYLAAARVGGIQANQDEPASFLYENLMIQANLVEAAHRTGVQRLLALGSSCIYPRLAEQPMVESALLTGALEPTNEPYAVAKIAGLKLCEAYNRQYGTDFRSVMPTNLYGPGDNFDLRASHVLPALLRRFHQARLDGADEVVVWGSGQARREFLHVDDLASACLFVMERSRDQHIAATSGPHGHLNVGTGTDVTIEALAQRISTLAGYEGRIVFDASRPDGAPRKLLDVGRLASLGWTASIDLDAGLADTYRWMVANWEDIRGRE